MIVYTHRIYATQALFPPSGVLFTFIIIFLMPDEFVLVITNQLICSSMNFYQIKKRNTVHIIQITNYFILAMSYYVN